jgi:anti-sigma factor RsiW
MLRENCRPYQENLPAYSLGALDADELAALESHIATCEDCKAELTEYQAISTGLLHALPPQTPPARLRRNLLTQLPSASKRTVRLIPQFNRFPLGQLINAAVVLALIAMNAYSTSQIRELRQQQDALAERMLAEQAAIGMLAFPATQIYTITSDVQNLTGSALVNKDRTTAVLLLWNLPEVDPTQIYQIWLINASGKPIGAGLFIPASGQNYTTALIQSSVPLGEFIAIGVTVEPAGGSEQPTGDSLLVVEL